MKFLHKSIAFYILVFTSMLFSCSKKNEVQPSPVPIPIATLNANIMKYGGSQEWLITINSDIYADGNPDVYLSWHDNSTTLDWTDTFPAISKNFVSGSHYQYQRAKLAVGQMTVISTATNIKIAGVKTYSNIMNFKY